MNCASCDRPISEHTVLPGRGHPTTGCRSFSFAINPDRVEILSAELERRKRGERSLHCPCWDTRALRPCSNCGFLFCEDCHERHEKGAPPPGDGTNHPGWSPCSLPKDSRHPGMEFSQPLPPEEAEAEMDPITLASVRAARARHLAVN